MNGGHLQDRATLGGGAGSRKQRSESGWLWSKGSACGQKQETRNKPGTDLNERKFPEPSGRMSSP